MDAEVQAYIDKLAEKSAAKEEVMAAIGQARLAEHEGRDASSYWQIVETKGMSGIEGQLHQELQDLADAYVLAHPETFASFEALFASEEGQDALVASISLWRETGMEEQAALATIWERARFNRKSIGVTPAFNMRPVGGKA